MMMPLRKVSNKKAGRFDEMVDANSFGGQFAPRELQ
jgi:hypothetical protein